MQAPKTDTIIGRYYQHFKGNKYVILHEAKDSETDAPSSYIKPSTAITKYGCAPNKCSSKT